MPKKPKQITQENLATVASDAISDLMHSLLTDVVTRLHEEGVITDTDRAIQIVDEVSLATGIDGIRLRRANVERRNVARRKAKTPTKSSSTPNTVSWTIHPKDKKLEYTKSIEIGKRYILRKAGTNKVVGLLDKNKLDDKKSSYGLKDNSTMIVNSAEMLMLKARGFELDKKIKARKEESSEEESSEEGSEESEESSEEESSEELPTKHRRKYRVCLKCTKKKSPIKYEGDSAICSRCMESMALDKEVTMKDLLIALDKINTSVVRLMEGKPF
ncbi:hypothetical protein BGZ82_011605 [Podila clonocystis]|nr:hypothetical protein BGZ82_011605 [Podila clonocystis]